MSFNRENIIWQSKNGLWNIGFFAIHESMISYSNDDDYDSEWDVDYDYERFSWASWGHTTADKAFASWKGANPGMTREFPYSEGGKYEREENKKREGYERMLADYKARKK